MSERTVIHLHGGAVGPGANLGDTLMLAEVIRRLRDRFGSELLLSIRTDAGPYRDRATLGLLQYPREAHPLHPRRVLGDPLLRRLGGAFGVVLDRDIALCLDFTGYRYFDRGRRETTLDRRMIASLARHGATTLLLPQAFGPFSTAALRADARQLFDLCPLVCARDTHSADAVEELGCRRPQVFPDLTLASPVGENPRPDLAGAIAIVPNLWMIHRTSPAEAGAYRRFLTDTIDRLRRLGLHCYLLLHSAQQDFPLAREIAASVTPTIEIIAIHDPLRAKALVGSARFVVGSRFHALLAALAQNVPVLATSWAPKYAGLLDDYGCPELLVSPARPAEASAALDLLLDDAARSRLAARFAPVNAAARCRLDDLWSLVLDRLAAALPLSV